MSDIIVYVQNHIEHAPYIIFGLLLLAGFNIPVSEDGMLFIAALMARHNPTYLPHLFTGVYLGAYLSDLICYGLGRTLGPKVLQIKFFSSMATPQRIDKIHDYYRRYGVITLILGRFVPFGVRNALFLTAGLGQMNLIKFALSDLLACTLSTIVFFTLYFQHGDKAVAVIQNANVAIFVAAAGLAAYFYFRKNKTHQADSD